MKILFIASHLYLGYPVFSRLINKLNKLGHNAYLLNSNIHDNLKDENYNMEQFKKDDCPMLNFHIIRLFSCKINPLRIIQFIINRQRIKRFITKNKIERVVIPSDLGPIYVRVFLDICEELKIPIRIILLTSSVVTPKKSIILKSLNRSHKLLRIFRPILYDYSTNKPQAIGLYAKSSFLSAPSIGYEEWLISSGIDSSRITINGNFYQKELLNHQNKIYKQEKNEIANKLSINKHHKWVVLLTEVIQELYGKNYILVLYKKLSSIFSKYSNDIKIVIKLHPREPDNIIAYMKDIFIGERYRFVQKDIDLYKLIRTSEGAVSHYSNVLENAVFVGTPIVGINLNERRKCKNGVEVTTGNLPMFCEEKDIVVAKSFDELEKKLTFLSNPEIWHRNFSNWRKKWMSRWGSSLPGDSYQRTAKWIVNS